MAIKNPFDETQDAVRVELILKAAIQYHVSDDFGLAISFKDCVIDQVTDLTTFFKSQASLPEVEDQDDLICELFERGANQFFKAGIKVPIT